MSIQWTTNKIRRAWLDFWKSKEHFEVPSKSLIPVNDPSLIWINSGVATLKKYFSGQELPPAPRLTNSQKSIRTNDIENVGLTSRHHTFFEMLGNFSIGNYFKTEAITWGFELLTTVFKFPLEKLYFTVFEDDIDAYSTWIKCGVDPKHIAKCNRDRNFWDVGSGPCGPCTEIYYDRGAKYDPKGIGEELFFKDIENDRYVEIWNIVFSQFNNDGKNNYTELAHKNIDTGCGLERLACVLQDTYTNFEIDIYANVIKAIGTLTNKLYKPDNYFNPSKEQTMINYAFRIIADHLKACTFAVADGAIPGNKDRGYIIRKLIRRAIVYAKKLEIEGSIIKTVVNATVEAMKDYYPYLENEKAKVIETLEKEEEQFNLTLKKGFELYEHAIKNDVIPGDVAFKLLDTYGFPIELTQELAAEKGVKVDMEGFKHCQEEHSKISKTNAPAKAMAVQNAGLMDFTLPSRFDYDADSLKAKVIGIFDKDFNQIDSLQADKGNWLVLDQTCIYANCGGEVADKGTIITKDGTLQVVDAIKGPNGQHFHLVFAPKGLTLSKGDEVEVNVDVKAKAIISAHHSTEHLIQAALKATVDENIKQMGAYKDHDKLTFDFQYHEKLSAQKLQEVEDLLNKWIKQGAEVTTHLKTLEEAQAMGALAYFTEVYSKIKGKLRVVKMGDISTEICAGRHVKNLKDIEQFHILKLDSKGSGAWRIVAISTNLNTAKQIKLMNEDITAKINLIKKHIEESKFDDQKFINKLNIKLSDDWEQTKKNLVLVEQLNAEFVKLHAAFKKNASAKFINDVVNSVSTDKGKYNYVALKDVDSSLMSPLATTLINKYVECGFILVNETSKISYLVAKNAKNNIAKAGEVISLINKATNGRGGGKDNFAQGSCELDAKNIDAIKSIILEINK